MRILFTGGFTLGSVTPLLAVIEELKEHNIIWVGTRKGPERKLVEEAGIKFFWIWAPKWRRYFDWRNILAPLLLSYSVIESLCLLLWARPDVIVTAGGFVGVPLVWAGWLLRIPSLLHNQDARWGLANRLVAPFVSRISYALQDTMPARWKHKAVWTGNPVREFILKGDKDRAQRTVLRDPKDSPLRVPTILIIGGGTGAQRLNEIVWEALQGLVKNYQVVHLVGRGKMSESGIRNQESGRYCCIEFVGKEIGDLYAAADLVITRGGMGALTELAALGKCMVIVPIHGTHQEDNAAYFEKRGAAVVLNQKTLNGEKLIKTIQNFFHETAMMKEMSERARKLSKPDAAKRVAGEIVGLAKK